MELFIVLLLLGLGYGVRGASDRVRGDLRKSREAKVKEAAKAAGGKLPKHQRATVARRHTRGWWAREVTGGFPAARTGWHAGWIAHKTALARQQIIREEARTEHAETQTSFRKDLAEHQKRQAVARAELERELAAQQAKGSPATGKSAVQKAADEVSRKREEKAARERSAPPLPATGTDTGVPPLPVNSVARKPVVTGTPAHAHLDRDSDWLEPGQPRCEGCGGRGSALGGTCPACRGFGSAPASPMSPVAPADAVCTACGNTGRPGDPVLADPGGNIHLSHAKEGQERYWDALNRMRQAGREPSPDAARWTPDDDRHAEIDDAVVAADHDFEGEFDTHRACRRCGAEAGHACKPGCDAPPSELEQNPTPSPTTTEVPPVRRAREDAEAADDAYRAAQAAGASDATLEDLALDAHDADAAYHRTLDQFDPPPPTTEGAPVTDTNYTAVLNAANARAAEAEQDAALIGIRLQTAFTDADGMQAADVDSATLSAQSELIDRLGGAKRAVDAVGEQAAVVANTVQRGHGGLAEAHQEAPVRAAKREFYEGN